MGHRLENLNSGFITEFTYHIPQVARLIQYAGEVF